MLEPIYDTRDFISEKMLLIEMGIENILLHKPLCLDLSMLEIRKIAMYKFWYYYVKS